VICDSVSVPGFVAKENVVISVAVKWVEIDKIDRLIFDVVAQYLQIATVVESVHGKREGNVALTACLGKKLGSIASSTFDHPLDVFGDDVGFEVYGVAGV